MLCGYVGCARLCVSVWGAIIWWTRADNGNRSKVGLIHIDLGERDARCAMCQTSLVINLNCCARALAFSTLLCGVRVFIANTARVTQEAQRGKKDVLRNRASLRWMNFLPHYRKVAYLWICKHAKYIYKSTVRGTKKKSDIAAQHEKIPHRIQTVLRGGCWVGTIWKCTCFEWTSKLSGRVHVQRRMLLLLLQMCAYLIMLCTYTICSICWLLLYGIVVAISKRHFCRRILDVHVCEFMWGRS